MEAKNMYIVLIVVAVVLAVAILAWRSGGKTTTGTPTVTQSTTLTGQAVGCPSGVRLVGSGSTFVWPAMNVWTKGFHSICQGVTIEYSGGGSGKGQKDIVNRLVDFACSDPPLARKYYEKYKGKLLQFPVVLGAVVVTYNLPEVGDAQLRLNGDVLARIYLGEIKYWDDPAIKKLNPELSDKLPHREIIAVHRSDASGTTQIFTLFLYKASKGAWPRELVGKTIRWPVDEKGHGIGQQGNQGVALAVKKTPYSIGYVEWAYALENNMPIALIENPAGKYVAPTPESVSAAFKARIALGPLDDWSSVVEDFVYSEASPDAYPIAGQTFMIVWKTGYSRDKCVALKKFIEYIVSEGQQVLPKGYAPLPEELRQVALKAVELLECSGKS